MVAELVEVEGRDESRWREGLAALLTCGQG